MAASTLLYTTLAVLAVYLIDDLGMSRAELGWVVSMFAITGAVLSPFAGRLVDRFGARAGVLGIFAMTAAGFAVMSIATSFRWLMAAALVTGFGQSLGNPATNSLIAHEYEPARRGLVMGVKQSGVQAGTFVGGLVFPRLAAATGWRSVPLALALTIGLAMAVSWLNLPRRLPLTASERTRMAAAIPGAVWWFAAYAFLMGAGGSPVFSFLPLYATEVVGMSEQLAGSVIAVGGLIGVVARIRWSLYAERRSEYAVPMVVIAVIAVAAGCLTIGAAHWGPLALWGSAILGWMSISAWNAVAMLAVITAAGPEASGKSSGVVLAGFLLGLAVSPPIFGWSVDRLGTYTPGFVVVVGLFVLATITMLVFVRRSSPVRPG